MQAQIRLMSGQAIRSVPLLGFSALAKNRTKVLNGSRWRRDGRRQVGVDGVNWGSGPPGSLRFQLTCKILPL
jgi:hypothetical protein